MSKEQEKPVETIDPKELRAGEHGDTPMPPSDLKNDTIQPPLSKPNDYSLDEN